MNKLFFLQKLKIIFGLKLFGSCSILLNKFKAQTCNESLLKIVFKSCIGDFLINISS